jgi:hypothetical protein
MLMFSRRSGALAQRIGPRYQMTVEDRHAGLASAINNAVARIGGLLAIAVLPAAAGITVGGAGVDLDSGFDTAMLIAGALCAVGGVVAWCTIRRAAPLESHRRGDVFIPCHPPCERQPDEPASLRPA